MFSPDNRILAFGEDTLSRRKYTLRFLDLETGEFLPDRIENTPGSAAWAKDSKKPSSTTPGMRLGVLGDLAPPPGDRSPG
ncbi:MAG: hypothetical protein U5N26_02540 [Candidatus Marinimicrobia bacterium]|nr:hypothetical protein [Candidatus Neomarinimicrobiota bacterium]